MAPACQRSNLAGEGRGALDLPSDSLIERLGGTGAAL
jgi:hypothetical protein